MFQDRARFVIFCVLSLLAAACSSGGSSSKKPVDAACNNGTLDVGEACDEDAFGSAVSSCTSLPGFASGTLRCKPDCLGYDVSGCVAGTVREVQTPSGSPSCAMEDVQRTLDAADDGDTVRMAAGNCTWTGLSRDGRSDAPLLIHDKNVILVGDPSGSTVISRTYEGGVNENRPTILVQTNKPFRIGYFTLKSTFDVSDAYGIWIYPGATDLAWRIDHLRFDHLSSTAVNFSGHCSGLIDHVEFTDVAGVGVDVEGDEPEDEYDGDAAWSRPLSLGTAEAVYVEDCQFTRSDQALRSHMGEDVASNRGSRYVVRHSQFLNSVDDVFAGYLDAHGNCNEDGRGSRSWEVYDNEFTLTGQDSTMKVMYIRGGDGVGFSNEFHCKPGSATGFQLVDQRVGESNCCAPYRDTPECVGAGGYPAPDQIRSAYFWDNTLNGTPSDPELQWSPDEDLGYIIEGRDYFRFEMPGYKPYAYPHPLTAIEK